MAPQDHPGEGPDIHAACKDAWKKAKDSGDRSPTMTVKKIVAVGTNPITGYRVILTPGG